LYVACEKEGFVPAFGDILSFGGNFTDSITYTGQTLNLCKNALLTLTPVDSYLPEF